jgi:hypothetical protein
MLDNTLMSPVILRSDEGQSNDKSWSSAGRDVVKPSSISGQVAFMCLKSKNPNSIELDRIRGESCAKNSSTSVQDLKYNMN